MPTQIPRPITMNRRQLLANAAVMPMSGILPPQVSADAVPMPTIPTSEPSPLNVCAATARHIEEITARNRIRAEACLPLLSIPKELRRMKEAADATEFERFAAHHSQSAWKEVLEPVRKAKGDPTWRPTGWMEGLGYQARVSKLLHERFIAQQHF